MEIFKLLNESSIVLSFDVLDYRKWESALCEVARCLGISRMGVHKAVARGKELEANKMFLEYLD